MSTEVGAPAEPRALLGRMVRQVWVEWAREQPHPKPSWLVSWDDLDDGQREVDMRIGTALFQAGKKAGIELALTDEEPYQPVTTVDDKEGRL